MPKFNTQKQPCPGCAAELDVVAGQQPAPVLPSGVASSMDPRAHRAIGQIEALAQHFKENAEAHPDYGDFWLESAESYRECAGIIRLAFKG
jgi:hypothetical protein